MPGTDIYCMYVCVSVYGSFVLMCCAMFVKQWCVSLLSVETTRDWLGVGGHRLLFTAVENPMDSYTLILILSHK